MEQLRNIFFEAEEHQITVLGNSFLQIFLRTGKEEGSFCVVTNYRLYMKGLFYKKVGRHYRRCREAQIIELSEIDACNFIQRSRWGKEMPMMEFIGPDEVLALPVDTCSDYECTEFQKHLRMAMAYRKRQSEESM